MSIMKLKPRINYWLSIHEQWMDSPQSLSHFCHDNDIDYQEMQTNRKLLKESGLVPDIQLPSRFPLWEYANVRHMTEAKLLKNSFYMGVITQEQFEKQQKVMKKKYMPIIEERRQELWAHLYE